MAIKKPVVHDDSVYDDFSRFALNHRDHNSEPFFIVVEWQIVQNYKCDTRYEKLMDDYKNKVAQGKKTIKQK